MRHLFITGGTGSFGSNVLKMELKNDWERISIFSRDEKKQYDLRKKIQDKRVRFIIGDTRDQESIELAMNGVSHVFHAAALKQVPTCEFFPLEAIKTNTIGTKNTIRAAKKHRVENFVLLSTDKAAYPINAMGMTKALAEKIALSEAFNDEMSDTKINITRYGNVMGSRGSVIPMFIEQLKNDQNFTITDARMTRFMMSLDQSVELVRHAFENGKNGEMFVLKSKSANILQICDAIETIFEKKVAKEFIGLRGGEKLYETLVTQEEMFRATDTGKYFCVKPDANYLAYNEYFSDGVNISDSNRSEYNSDNAESISTEEIATWFTDLGFMDDVIDP